MANRFCWRPKPAQNHRQFDRMALRTFYLPGLSSAQELTDVVNLLRNLFEIRLVTPQPQASTIIVRAPRNILDAATRLLEGYGDSRPQVMLDVHVYEITNSLTRNMGLQIPNTFSYSIFRRARWRRSAVRIFRT